MTTQTLTFSARRALNPILADRLVFDEERPRLAFLTPAALRVERFIPLIGALTAGACLLAGYLLGKYGGPQPLADLAILIAFVLGGIPGLKSAWESLLDRQIDIDVLMLLGAVLAAVIGQPIEGALLLFLFALSGAMEEEATRRTQRAISALHQLSASDALVLQPDGTHRETPTRAVPLQARVLVRPGDRVPLDGTVIEGESTLNEAPITGESAPRPKGPGDAVYAGTINGAGRLVIEVTRAASDTQLAKIIRLVTQARSQKAKLERLFDRIGPTYSIVSITAAVAVGALAPLIADISWRESLYRAIALLIVASPCALIIATPTAYLSAIGSAARHGVMIKGGVYLELLARCRGIVFDKTGTLTVGQPRLVGVKTSDGLTDAAALQAAGALESSSSHPLAAAINRELEERGLRPLQAADVRMAAGHGLVGNIDGKTVALGRSEFVENHLAPAVKEPMLQAVEKARAEGRTATLMAYDGQAAVLLFEDPIREDAAGTIAHLRAMGFRDLVMLTGDHPEVARRTAETLGLNAYHANLLPEDKIEHVRQIRESVGMVAMVGDGVNDAPALAHADVGIAIASIGSDAALEAAPIVLMSNKFERLEFLARHARRTARIILQNLTLAIGVIVVLSMFAVAGKVDLPWAVIAHEGSTLVVAANALRLLRA